MVLTNYSVRAKAVYASFEGGIAAGMGRGKMPQIADQPGLWFDQYKGCVFQTYWNEMHFCQLFQREEGASERPCILYVLLSGCRLGDSPAAHFGA